MSCGLDVEPKVAFRKGQIQKENMKKKLVLAAASAFLLAALPVQANMIVNGNFNSGLTGWTKTSSTGLFVLSSTGISGGGNINLNDATLTGGGAGVSAAATLSIALTPGRQYAVTFSDFVSPAEPNTNPNPGPYQGGQPAVNGILEADSLVVDLDGAPTHTIGYNQLSTTPFSGGYQTFTLYFTDVSTPGSLSFTWYSSELSGNGAEQQNIQLDNVSVVAVPDLSTPVEGVLMLLLPLGAMALQIQRNKRVAQQ